MQTRSSPSLQTLHRLARQASIPDYKSLSKGALYRRLQEQFDIERLQRAESRGSKAKQSHNDAEVEKADVDCVHRKKKARKSHKDKESFDPIMREPLGKHIYTFQRPNGSCAQFNVESLVDYLLCSGDFTDPESRLPFSDKDLRDIDNVAIKAGLKKASVLAAKRENSEIYADRNFVRDALQGLERCAGEVVVEMLNIVEECDPEEAEMRLLMREFPMFSDLYRQIKVADATYAKQCMRSWQLYLRGPPNKPTQDEYGLLHVVLHFMRCLEMHGNQPGVWNPPSASQQLHQVGY
mmetsp:Transcript_12575/g.18996  ORF Transcript_12575/g.18996 Transcript_12575/m.18996 type:complete len:294 (+) Transcript_12575:150-1031(+)|eukprot:CAMPEP_0185027066 /NCGR_PEP_ID=MMETSP1103-20130426/11882_1 /TAXON_ID=36769 /ORGANISM="Paraphysomonas bandaiensis, Strain Caron Lab Isolate" /LENGTH=293 /DNA_ID=CAMNT_0027560911 /DNA_START=140 /DNA_END=1021 /DNA_ORIENTATION=+